MKVLAIDPGTEESAWIVYDAMHQKILARGMEHNENVLQRVRYYARRTETEEFDQPDKMVIEEIEGFGLAVGRDVFRTVMWSGRMFEAWQHGDNQIPVYMVSRRKVKFHLCNSARAKDPNIRRVVIDRFGGDKAIGSKKNPGPLYGITADLWAALALAITWSELYMLGEVEPEPFFATNEELIIEPSLFSLE